MSLSDIEETSLSKHNSGRHIRRLSIAAAVAPMLGACAAFGSGAAFGAILETDNPDLQVRWDNTVRLNTGWRMQDRDPRVANNSQFDSGDFKVDKGDAVLNRFDLFSEFDLTYQRKYGFRASGAGWVAAENSSAKFNPAFTGPAAASQYTGNSYSRRTNRFYKGPSGEILDAFVFGNFDNAPLPFSVRVGRLTSLWGESLFSPVHGVNYGQSPTDGRKAVLSPGATAKELSLPVGQVSGQVQVSPEVSLLGQYFLEWKPNRGSESGTYFGAADALEYGPDRFRAPPILPKNSGNFGVAARWSPVWLDGTLGAYYRKLDERAAWTLLAPGAPAGTTRSVYAKGTELLGFSLSRSLGGMSLGADLVYRKNTAFNSVASPLSEGARGNSVHAVVNLQNSLRKNAIWDSAALNMEMQLSRWLSVRNNPSAFKAAGFNAACPNDDITNNCVTRNFAGLNITFQPTWSQVLPSLDITGLSSLSVGARGVSAVLGGGAQGAGSYSLGVQASYASVHFITLQYAGFFGKSRQNNNSIGTAGYSTLQNPLMDRGWLSLSYQTSF